MLIMLWYTTRYSSILFHQLAEQSQTVAKLRELQEQNSFLQYTLDRVAYRDVPWHVLKDRIDTLDITQDDDSIIRQISQAFDHVRIRVLLDKTHAVSCRARYKC